MIMQIPKACIAFALLGRNLLVVNRIRCYRGSISVDDTSKDAEPIREVIQAVTL